MLWTYNTFYKNSKCKINRLTKRQAHISARSSQVCVISKSYHIPIGLKYRNAMYTKKTCRTLHSLQVPKQQCNQTADHSLS